MSVPMQGGREALSLQGGTGGQHRGVVASGALWPAHCFECVPPNSGTAGSQCPHLPVHVVFWSLCSLPSSPGLRRQRELTGHLFRGRWGALNAPLLLGGPYLQPVVGNILATCKHLTSNDFAGRIQPVLCPLFDYI